MDLIFIYADIMITQHIFVVGCNQNTVTLKICDCRTCEQRKQLFHCSTKVISRASKAGMWKWKLEAEAVNFLWKWKRRHFDESVGSGSDLKSESVEKELEAEAIFTKSGASGFSN